MYDHGTNCIRYVYRGPSIGMCAVAYGRCGVVFVLWGINGQFYVRPLVQTADYKLAIYVTTLSSLSLSKPIKFPIRTWK